jgi:hypothetical protein
MTKIETALAALRGAIAEADRAALIDELAAAGLPSEVMDTEAARQQVREAVVSALSAP